MAFADRGFEFLLDLGLRFTQHVFDDGLASFRIVTDSVSSLPSTVLSLADVPFPVCSSLWHGISPFRNEQYRNQGNKAIEKPNCYQKVIICTSESCRLIFVYGGANFALPGGALFGYSGAILERLKNPFIDCSGAKYARLALPVLRDVITSVSSKNSHKAPLNSLGHLRLRELRRQPL